MRLMALLCAILDRKTCTLQISLLKVISGWPTKWWSNRVLLYRNGGCGVLVGADHEIWRESSVIDTWSWEKQFQASLSYQSHCDPRSGCALNLTGVQGAFQLLRLRQPLHRHVPCMHPLRSRKPSLQPVVASSGCEPSCSPITVKYFPMSSRSFNSHLLYRIFLCLGMFSPGISLHLLIYLSV